MTNQLRATRTKVELRTLARQAGHEVAGEGAIQIRQANEQKNISKAVSVGPIKDTLWAALERAQEYTAKVLEFTGTSPSPYAACPSCGYDMTVITVRPTFLREGCEDINYACTKCGTQSQRTAKASNTAVRRRS
jgi:DNA-directed RNA polymerase subunit RPC12/RpoP